MTILKLLRNKIDFPIFCYVVIMLTIKEFFKNITGHGISDLAYKNSQKIHDVSKNGNVSQLEELIMSGTSFNHKNHHSARPIHFAVLNRNKNILIKLVEYGADINCSDCFGLQPIHYLAQYQGTIENLSILLDLGADINAEDYNGNTTLYYALKETTIMKLYKIKPNTELINALIIHGADLKDLDEFK